MTHAKTYVWDARLFFEKAKQKNHQTSNKTKTTKKAQVCSLLAPVNIKEQNA